MEAPAWARPPSRPKGGSLSLCRQVETYGIHGRPRQQDNRLPSPCGNEGVIGRPTPPLAGRLAVRLPTSSRLPARARRTGAASQPPEPRCSPPPCRRQREQESSGTFQSSTRQAVTNTGPTKCGASARLATTPAGTGEACTALLPPSPPAAQILSGGIRPGAGQPGASSAATLLTRPPHPTQAIRRIPYSTALAAARARPGAAALNCPAGSMLLANDNRLWRDHGQPPAGRL